MIKRVNCIKIKPEDVLELLIALGDPTRQDILRLFQRQGEYCANDVAKQFKLSRPTISHHLNLLKRSKILTARKDGKEIYYSFNKEYVIKNLELLIEYFRSCC
jgi:DNA-binding transcriptional ArsR family regulator